MEAKAYPAFGYTLVRCKIPAGEIINDISVADGVMSIDSVNETGVATVNGNGYIWIQILGQQTYKFLPTGESTIHPPGWCNLVEEIKVGDHEIRVDTDSEHICLSTYLNENRKPQIPSLTYLRMKAGEKSEIKKGTKLYLIDGVLDASGQKFSGMRQIHFSSGGKVISADTDCMGLIFNL